LARLAPAAAIVARRAFSHLPPNGRDMPVDQALYQFQRFVGWDGHALANVVLQTNGPFDFQVREPVHALLWRAAAHKLGA
jgi:alpha-glucuronidase